MAKADIPRKAFALEDLHPLMRGPVFNLMNMLEADFDQGRTRTDFAVFEGYRSAERQQLVFENGASKAQGWQSAHQFGLAVDVVPVGDEGWSWGPDWDYDLLSRRARECGLDTPLKWDRVHVEHPAFGQLKSALRKIR